MSRFVTIAVVVLILGLAGLAHAQESTDGVIDGHVVNGTAGGGNVSGLNVTLITFIDGTMGETKTTVTDDQGRFQFTGLATDPGYGYLLSAHYKGVDYYSAVVFGEDETSASVEVPVYETTASDEAIRVVVAHAIVVVEEESLSVTEILQFSNDGDRTYVGSEEIAADGRKAILVFTLPHGATDFEAAPELMQDLVFLGNSTFVDTLPFPPGDRELVYSYRLAMPSSNDASILLAINYPTDEFSVMVQGKDVEVNSDQLTLAEPIGTDTGEWFIHLKAENIPRGVTLNIHLSRLSGGVDSASLVLWIIVAVLILGIIVYVFKRKRAVSVPSAVLSVEGDIEPQRQRLLREIAQLDDEFEQGSINEDIYRQRRSEKKAQLLELMRWEKEGKSNG